MKKNLSYSEQSQVLDGILEELQRGEIDIDAAIALYEKGMKIVDQLSEHLRTAENTISRVTLAEDSAS